ncbi:hypothetical protein ACLKA7_017427 [Drosophila subpalustris]
MPSAVITLTLIFACLATPTFAQFNRNRNRQTRQGCTTPEGYYGSCVALSYCPQVLQAFNKADRQTAQDYAIALHRICGTRSVAGDPLVCCTRPEFNAATEQTTKTLFPVVGDEFVTPRPVSFPQTTQVPMGNPFLPTTTTTTTTTAAPVTSTYFGQTPARIVNYNTIPRRLPHVEEGCGYTLASSKKIVGGSEAKKGAYPWIALLGYGRGETSAATFKCGGTLITARHVLTAAHCMKPDLSFVRLGEHDLSTDAETQHIDIPIVKTAPHPEYNRLNGRSDIAILYLERNVEFTSLILPICMPNLPSLRAKSYVGTFPTVAGWGKTQEHGESATVLHELMIPVMENEVCRSSYARLNRTNSENQFDKAVLCAGVLTGGKDSCNGDSGGPLMTTEGFGNQLRFYLIGIVSYGVGCARPEVPGVYTSTQFFMDWILQKLEDTP